MAQKVRIALDAMGGDFGPAVVVPGAEIALARHPDTEFVLFGDEAVDRAAGRAAPAAARRPRASCTPTSWCKMDDKPSQALRHGPLEVLDVARDRRGEEGRGRRRGLGRQHRRADGDGEVQPAHHAGHRAPGDRRRSGRRCKGDSVVLDVGASIGADARSSGRSRRDGQRDGARAVRPGAADRRAAQYRRRGGEGAGSRCARRAQFLREANLPFLDYVGFVEGDDDRQGRRRRGRDAKASPATSRSRPRREPRGRSPSYLRARDERGPGARRLGYLLAREAFRTLRDKMDPRKANGGVFLGLNGIVIKSHGGTDAEGFAAAVDVGYDMVRYELLNKISDTLLRHAREEAAPGKVRSRFVTVTRSVVLGCGSYLPQRCLTNDDLARIGRHVRRMDRAAHRHPRAPHRGRRRVDLRSRHRGGARRARRRAGRCAVDRPDRGRDLDAGQHVSGERGRRCRPALGITHGAAFDLQAVCSGFVYRAGDRRRAVAHGRAQARAGDRRGDLLAHPRLDRSRHLRAVRRRRRRGRARGAAAAGHARGSRHPHRAPALRRAAQEQAVSSTAARPRPARSAICAWRARRFSASRSARSPT